MVSKCRLCSREATLIDSHLLPKALYRLLRDPSLKNPNPVFVTQGNDVQTSSQLKRYLLCYECEKRFNKNGESWVLKHCFRGGPLNKFLLRDMLAHTAPSSSNAAGDVVPTAGIAEVLREKLEYFAASVFWRASGSDWPIHGQLVPKITLPALLQAAFAEYLLRNSTFPDTCSLLVYLAGDPTPPLAMHPPQCGNSSGLLECRFSIPGLRFSLLPEVPKNGSSITCSPHPVCISKIQSQLIAQQAMKLRGTF